MTAYTLEQARKPHLDGLRGLAALTVVLAHLQTFAAGPEYDLLTNPVPTRNFDGATAVCIFFTLSGVVLWEGREPRLPLLAAVVKRYLRLTLVILATSLLPFVIAVAQETGSVGFDAAFATRFPGWLMESAGGVYWSGTSGYNPVLWTMRPEFLGSVAIFVAARVAGYPVMRAVAGCGAIVAFAAHPTPTVALLGLFAVGVMLRLNEHRLTALPPRRAAFASASALVAAGATEAMCGCGFVVAAVLIVFAACLPSPIQRICASAPARWLGRVSFALYLTHVTAIELVLHSIAGIRTAPIIAATAAAGALALSLALAAIFTAAVDVPAIRLSRWAGAWLSRQRVVVKSA